MKILAFNILCLCLNAFALPPEKANLDRGQKHPVRPDEVMPASIQEQRIQKDLVKKSHKKQKKAADEKAKNEAKED